MRKNASHSILAVVLTAAVFFSVFGCTQSDKKYRIGVINLSQKLDAIYFSFKEGMAELGYKEGHNTTYIYEGAFSDIEKLDSAAERLIEADVDLILSLTTPATLAAQRATSGTGIPVVFIPVTDPVGAGLVKSLIKPGGNLTGITYSVQEGRRLEWLIKVVPSVKNVYIVYNPADRSPVLALETVRETAKKLDLTLIVREAATPEKVEKAFSNIPVQADAIFFLPDSLTNDNIEKWLKKAVERKLPTSGSNTALVEDGVLTTYGIDLKISARKDAARLADQILRGVKPEDLPVETAEFFSAINLKTAGDLGIKIPDDILRQTDIILR